MLCFAWGLALGIAQLGRLGLFALKFATVWNWWLLTLYFGVASSVSTKAALGPLGGAQAGAAAAASAPAGPEQEVRSWGCAALPRGPANKLAGCGD